jgi:hypothetical protein
VASAEERGRRRCRRKPPRVTTPQPASSEQSMTAESGHGKVLRQFRAPSDASPHHPRPRGRRSPSRCSSRMSHHSCEGMKCSLDVKVPGLDSTPILYRPQAVKGRIGRSVLCHAGDSCYAEPGCFTQRSPRAQRRPGPPCCDRFGQAPSAFRDTSCRSYPPEADWRAWRADCPVWPERGDAPDDVNDSTGRER